MTPDLDDFYRFRRSLLRLIPIAIVVELFAVVVLAATGQPGMIGPPLLGAGMMAGAWFLLKLRIVCDAARGVRGWIQDR